MLFYKFNFFVTVSHTFNGPKENADNITFCTLKTRQVKSFFLTTRFNDTFYLSKIYKHLDGNP